MRVEFEKYQTLTKSLTSIRDNIRTQALDAIVEILQQQPNNEVIIDSEDDRQNIWTDDNELVERVYLSKSDGRILIDTEFKQEQEWFRADEIDILDSISYIVINELKPQWED